MIALFTLNGMAQEKQTVSGDKVTQKKEVKSPEDMAAMETKKMTKMLNLSSEQQTQVYEVMLEKTKVNQESRAERTKMKQSGEKVSKEDYKKIKMKVLDQQKKTTEKMKEILSEKQFLKYEKMYGKKPNVKSNQLKRG